MNKAIPVRTVAELAKVAYNLSEGIENHIDFYTCLDVVQKTVSECYAISKVRFFDTTVFLIGGYGTDVESVSIPQHFYRKENVELVLDELKNTIYGMMDSDRQEQVGIDFHASEISWNLIPNIKKSLETAEQYTLE